MTNKLYLCYCLSGHQPKENALPVILPPAFSGLVWVRFHVQSHLVQRPAHHELQTTPSKPSRIVLIVFWDSPRALEMEKGLLKWSLPMRVVRWWESGNGRISQNQLLASSLLRTVAPVSCTSASSTLRIRCTSHNPLSLSGFKSTQILTAPVFFSTAMKPAHLGVGSFTFEITPKTSIQLRSSWTWFHR